MVKIYTRTGDDGETGLYGAERVAKDHPRVEAYGNVDETNSAIGLARAWLEDSELDHILEQIQNTLFDLGADLATRWGSSYERKVRRISEEDVTQVEGWIDRLDEELPPLQHFIHPGGHPAAATLHLARTFCRRAERRVVTLSREETVNPQALRYLNRLSDLLFVLARAVNARKGIQEALWKVQNRS